MAANRRRAPAGGRRRSAARVGGWCLAGMLASGVAAGEDRADLATGPVEAGAVIEVRADRLEYDGDTGWVTGVGHVVIRRGEEELRADVVRFNSNTEDVEARGNVSLRRGSELWTGQELRHNFRLRTGSVLGLAGGAEPFRIRAERSEAREGNTYLLHNARITTCRYEEPDTHYVVHARKVLLTPGEHFKAWGVVWYLGRVPVLYVPFWHRTLREGFGFQVYPGYDSRMGTFLLTSYKYRLSPEWDGRTHLDYRTRRGVALGQDLAWRLWEGRSRGSLKLYYAADRRPVDPDEDPETADIPHDRYRIRVRNGWQLSPRDEVVAQADFLSDPDLLEDFFESDYRRLRQPDNFVAYGHRGSGYNAGLLLRKRLNDFYEQVERLPEATLDVVRRPIGTGGFYYESQNAASLLRHVYPRGGAESESASRVDSRHAFYYPDRLFGFLSWVPRAAYRGTFYSRTLTGDLGPGLRSSVELGQEFSLQAYRLWPGERPMRHLVEPYVNWNWMPRPTIRPENLPQFDRVDTLRREHWIQLGVRNRLQRKVEGRSYDLADVNCWTTWKLYRADDENAVERVSVDAEIRPAPWLWVDMDGAYHLPDRRLEEWNSRVRLRRLDWWTLALEHRYRADRNNLLSLDVSLLPDRAWAYDGYVRYEFETTRLEEAGAWIQRNLDCMSVRGGVMAIPGYRLSDGSRRDDEWRVSLELWLTAFPETRIGGKYRK